MKSWKKSHRSRLDFFGGVWQPDCFFAFLNSMHSMTAAPNYWSAFPQGSVWHLLSVQTSSTGADCQQIYMKIRVLLVDKSDEFTYYCSVCFRASILEANSQWGGWELADSVQTDSSFKSPDINSFLVRRFILLQSNDSGWLGRIQEPFQELSF